MACRQRHDKHQIDAMNRSPSGPMVYLPATAQLETGTVTRLALISPAPDAGWRPRFARTTCAHPLPAVDAAITACEREQSGTALRVAGTLTKRPSTEPAVCPPKPNGSTLDKRGGLRLVSSKVFLSPNVRLSDETWSEHPQWSLLESFGNVDYSPLREVGPMAKYVPSPRDWVREQVELYEVVAVPKAPPYVIQDCR